jgi:hypothetical protein
MGGGASAPRAQTLDELIISSGSEDEETEEESEEEDNLLEQRRTAKAKKSKFSKPKVVKARKVKAKKKLPRNVVTDQMRWEVPERYQYPQPEGQVEVIKDPVDGKVRPRTDYPLGGPSEFHAFWRGRLGPLNDMLNLDGSLKKQKRPAHGGIKGAPKDKWADGGAKLKEQEMRQNMTEKEKRKLRKQKEAEAAKRKQAGSSASLAQLEDQSPPGSPGSSEQDSDEEGGSPKKTSASFRFKSPSRLFGASFRDKSKGKGD